MKAYRFKSGIVISPFQDPVGDSLILNRPLRDHQKRLLEASGLELVEINEPSSIQDEECILIRDDLYVSRAALERFIKKARAVGASGACALEKGPFTDFTGFIQDLPARKDPASGKECVLYGLYYLRGTRLETGTLDTLPPLTIEAQQRAFPIEPGTFMPSSVEIRFAPAYTDAVIMHIRHWTHLWLLNLLALGDRLLETFLASRLRLFLRALSAFSFNKHKIADRFVVKGKHCDIHPTAVVQGSILGDHVQVGPFCVIQGCVLGDHVKVSEQTIIMGSILGDRVSTCPRGWIKFCVVYPGSSTGRMHACLIGRDVFMASLAYFFDVKLQGTIKVLHQGKHVDTGMNFLGGCVGHGATIGPDTWLASGREVPNGAMIVKNPADVISVIPPDLPPREPLAVSGGVLTRVRDLPLRQDVPADKDLPGSSKNRE